MLEEEERSGLPAEGWNRRRRSVPDSQSLDSGMLEGRRRRTPSGVLEQEEEECSGLPVS